jgi:hypothetical protein
MSQILIIAIDPGQTGGISSVWYDPFTNQCDELWSCPMPKGIRLINDHIQLITQSIDKKNIFVFIEKLSMFQSDTDSKANPGMKFRLQQMHKHYAELTTALTLNGFKFFEVSPMTWQSRLSLRTKGVKEDKQIRKKRYKEFAQEQFKSIKVNLKTSDSLCILYFAMLQISNNKKEYLVNN